MTVAPGEESMRNVLGTPSYMAPELWAGIESGGAAEYDSSVDMWALGVVSCPQEPPARKGSATADAASS